jgi:hypothetical protein
MKMPDGVITSDIIEVLSPAAQSEFLVESSAKDFNRFIKNLMWEKIDKNLTLMKIIQSHQWSKSIVCF